jgi:hypothetical protein
VPNAKTRYQEVDLRGNPFGHPAGMSIYLTNDYSQTGYLETDKKGKTVLVMPYDG